MTSPSDIYDRVGFKVDEIYPFLERYGLSLPRGDEATALVPFTPAVSEPPEWLRPYIGRKQISINDTASILAGVDTPGYGGDQYEDVGRWVGTLIEAVDEGEIEASEWRYYDEEPRSKQNLSHEGIRAWCASRGHVWPVPNPRPLPTTDAELAERLRAAEVELEQLRAADGAVTDAAYYGDDLKKQLAEKDEELTELYAWLRDADGIAVRANQAESERDVALQEVERLRPLVPSQPVWLMEIAVAVQRRYWGDNWEPDNRDSWPKQAVILEWIKNTHPTLSELQRKAIEIVACPVDRKK